MSSAPAAYATKRWNPTTGCSPISAGCLHCWARLFAWRHKGRYGYPEEEPFAPTMHLDRLQEPFSWKTPQVVAVSFMGDLFHEEIPVEFVRQVFDVMGRCPKHRFLLLTKRPAAYKAFAEGNGEGKLLNVWVGVSAENQEAADERIGVLLQAPAAHRWVSCEPQLGPIDLSKWTRKMEVPLFGGITVPGLDWVVQGCESGAMRRPFGLDWARQMRDACHHHAVPYYLKQAPWFDGEEVERIDRAPRLDGKRHVELPWPEETHGA